MQVTEIITRPVATGPMLTSTQTLDGVPVKITRMQLDGQPLGAAPVEVAGVPPPARIEVPGVVEEVRAGYIRPPYAEPVILPDGPAREFVGSVEYNPQSAAFSYSPMQSYSRACSPLPEAYGYTATAYSYEPTPAISSSVVQSEYNPQSAAFSYSPMQSYSRACSPLPEAYGYTATAYSYEPTPAISSSVVQSGYPLHRQTGYSSHLASYPGHSMPHFTTREYYEPAPQFATREYYETPGMACGSGQGLRHGPLFPGGQHQAEWGLKKWWRRINRGPVPHPPSTHREDLDIYSRFPQSFSCSLRPVWCSLPGSRNLHSCGFVNTEFFLQYCLLVVVVVVIVVAAAGGQRQQQAGSSTQQQAAAAGGSSTQQQVGAGRSSTQQATRSKQQAARNKLQAAATSCKQQAAASSKQQ